MRIIMHVDLDAFYSSIEQRDRPELRGKPVVVGGDPDGRGVVATASYEARTFGVRSAMPCRTARRLCPQAIFVHPRFDVYHAVSRQLRGFFAELTPLIEPIAFDEAFLDVTVAVAEWSAAEKVARQLKRRIADQTQLTASVGIATNKLVAKVASDREKPDGLTIVSPGEEQQFLAPLPVRTLFGIGPRSEERLKAVGIKLASQLADAEQGWMVARFGQTGLEWQRMARGIDERPVEPNRELKVASRERTFREDVAERAELHAILDELVADLSPVVQDCPPARTITLKMRYADWTTVTRRMTPGTIVTAELLGARSRQLFEESWDGRSLRLMGIGVSNFVLEPEGQLSLF